MLGFEIEIDLAVTDAAGDLIDGDTDLARSTTVPSFRLVSDSRSLTEHTDYSNIEFVTDAVSVVGPDSATGPAAVARQLAEVERIRDALYLANAAPLARADGTLTMAPAGAGARLAPDLGYDESDTLLVHYSTGVPLAGLPRFFDELRAAAPVGRLGPKDHPSLIRDRFSLHQARSFAADEMAKFHQRPHAPADGSLESRKLDGFLQLAYMQVCALADHLDYDGKGGNIKNLTAVLCRSAFADVVPLRAPHQPLRRPLPAAGHPRPPPGAGRTRLDQSPRVPRGRRAAKRQPGAHHAAGLLRVGVHRQPPRQPPADLRGDAGDRTPRRARQDAGADGAAQPRRGGQALGRRARRDRGDLPLVGGGLPPGLSRSDRHAVRRSAARAAVSEV
jgi:hypothetical protein